MYWIIANRISEKSIPPSRDKSGETTDSPAEPGELACRATSQNSSRIGIGMAWIIAFGLVLAACAGFDSGKTDATSVDRNACRTLQPIPIEEIQVGQRVAGVNPAQSNSGEEWPQPEPELWQRIELQCVHDEGKTCEIVLLRPRMWLISKGAKLGATIELDMPEMGVAGQATIRSIERCPPIDSGPGNVVTGTFSHLPNAQLVDVRFETLADPVGCTANHPFWSSDRKTFVPARELQVGEKVHAEFGEQVSVVSVTPRPDLERVYNIEVYGEHVYLVSSLGIVVHNTCWFDEWGIEPKQKLPDLDTPSGADGSSHVTYVIKDRGGRVVYVGKASTSSGTPQQALQGRLGNHAHYNPSSGDVAEIIDVQRNADACAGAEQYFKTGFENQGAKLRNVNEPLNFRWNKNPGKSGLAKTMTKIHAFFVDWLGR